VGSLKLEGFINLQTLVCSSHELIELDVSDCINLEELDCHDNELTALKVDGCSNLKKIDCSKNSIRELDLSDCVALQKVGTKGCSKLTEDKIKSNLIYDSMSGELVKSNLQAVQVKNDYIRNILIIGITGNGKSALANTLSDTSNNNKFGEGSSSSSVTKSFQEGEVFD